MQTQHTTDPTIDTLEVLYWEARDSGRDALAKAIGLALDAAAEASQHDADLAGHGGGMRWPATMVIARSNTTYTPTNDKGLTFKEWRIVIGRLDGCDDDAAEWDAWNDDESPEDYANRTDHANPKG
jgi:hypothetical protein